MMTYYELAQDIEITREGAMQVLKNHGISDELPDEIALFDTEVKPKDSGMYLATDVLDWLGY